MSFYRNRFPFIASQGVRILSDRIANPRKFLSPQSFRQERSRSPSAVLRRAEEVASGSDSPSFDEAWPVWPREDFEQLVLRNDQGELCPIRRLFLTVDSGVGKSTNMRRLEAAINDRLGEQLAFYIDLSRVRCSLDDFIEQELCRQIQHRIAPDDDQISTEELLKEIGSLRRRGRLVLLLDALDQASPRGREVLWDLLSSAAWKHCRVVVSGRPYAVFAEFENGHGIFHTSGDEWRFARLDEFTAGQQAVFLGVTNDGRSRHSLIPHEAQEIFSVPRVLETIRNDVHDSELAGLKTPSDVYALAIPRLVAGGLAGGEAKRIGLEDHEQPRAKSDRSKLEFQVEFVMTLLSAIAFEMYRNDSEDDEPLPDEHEPNFAGIDEDDFARFRKRVQRRFESVRSVSSDRWFAEQVSRLFDLNALVDDGLLEQSGPGHSIVWRSRTLQEFMAAWWAANHIEKDEADDLWDWIYLPWFETTDQYYEFWRFLCEMPKSSRDRVSWLRSIAPLYRQGDGNSWYPDCPQGTGTKRSNEMIYRSWPTLHEFCTAGRSELAREVRELFWGELEMILAGERGIPLQQQAIVLRDSFQAADVDFGQSVDLFKGIAVQTMIDQVQRWVLQARAAADFDEWYVQWKGNVVGWIDGPIGERQSDFMKRAFESAVRSGPSKMIERLRALLDSYELRLHPSLELVSQQPISAQCYLLYDPSLQLLIDQAVKETPAVVNWFDASVFAIWTRWDDESCQLTSWFDDLIGTAYESRSTTCVSSKPDTGNVAVTVALDDDGQSLAPIAIVNGKLDAVQPQNITMMHTVKPDEETGVRVPSSANAFWMGTPGNGSQMDLETRQSPNSSWWWGNLLDIGVWLQTPLEWSVLAYDESNRAGRILRGTAFSLLQISSVIGNRRLAYSRHGFRLRRRDTTDSERQTTALG